MPAHAGALARGALVFELSWSSAQISVVLFWSRAVDGLQEMGCKRFVERMQRTNEHTIIRWELVCIAQIPAVGDNHTYARGTAIIQPLPFNVVVPVPEISFRDTYSLLTTHY